MKMGVLASFYTFYLYVKLCENLTINDVWNYFHTFKKWECCIIENFIGDI